MPAVGLLNPVPPFAARQIARYLATTRIGQSAWHAAGARTDNSVAGNLRRLFGDGVVLVVVAIRAFRRDEEKAFG
jgi:hypothetical protein